MIPSQKYYTFGGIRPICTPEVAVLPQCRVPGWRVVLTPLTLALFASPSIQAAPVPSSLPVLTAPRQIHGLTNEEAARGYPVRLNGAIVLYYNPDLDNLFVLEPTGGVYVGHAEPTAPPASGGR